MDEDEKTTTRKKRKVVPAKVSYINVNRSAKGYRDKYLKDVKKAIKTFAEKIGKQETGEDFTDDEWKLFFKTNLIPLDKASELHMIDLFKDNRLELNKLLVLHNTKAGENIAEVYFKRYMKDSPTKWYDLDDFKQMANEGLAIAAERFDPSKGNKFITFATWWMLNRVRKPNQEKGAMVNHSSLSSPLNSNDADSVNTLEDVLSPNSLSPDWNSVSNSMGVLDPISSIEYKSTVESMEIFSTMRDTQLNSIDNIDKNKVENMIEYLMSIVEQNENSYDNKQIYLYIFKKVFNKYQTIFKDNQKLSKYVSEAAKSKNELLHRLKMNEKQYECACKRLTRSMKLDGFI